MKAMDKCTRKLSLCQRASYQIEVVGHLDVNKATWFEGLMLVVIFVLIGGIASMV